MTQQSAGFGGGGQQDGVRSGNLRHPLVAQDVVPLAQR